MVEEGYDTAQVCLNGHIITASAASDPQFQKKFCDKCGERTVMECESCQISIRGHYHDPDFFESPIISLPSFCHNCGKPFPWTQKRLQAAIDLVAEDDKLSARDKEQFNQSVNDITRDTPQAQVGATRIKKVLTKATAGTANAFRELFIDVVSKTVKEIIWSL